MHKTTNLQLLQLREPVSTQVCHAEILLFAVLGLASLATASVFIFGYKLTYFCAFKFNICKLYQVLLNSGYGPAMVFFWFVLKVVFVIGSAVDRLCG